MIYLLWRTTAQSGMFSRNRGEGGGGWEDEEEQDTTYFSTWPAVSFSLSLVFFFFFNIKDICGRFHMGFMDCVGGNVPSVRQHFSARPNTLRKVWLKLRGGVINPHHTLIQSHSSSF